MANQLNRVSTAASAVTALAAGDTLELAVPGHQAHTFLGVSFYTSSAASTPAVPTAGTLVFDVKTLELPDVWQRVSVTVDLTTGNRSADFAANAYLVRVSGLSSVTGGSATHCILRVTSNIS
jgi:hypothetical protein